MVFFAGVGEKIVSQAERVKNNRRIRGKRRKIAPVFGLWLLLIFCCLLAGYFFINSAFFALQYINIDGNIALSDEEIVAQSGLSLGTNLFRLDAQEATVRIEMYPVVKKVEIKRKMPGTLNVMISERTTVARVIAQDGFIEVDNEGVYLKKITGCGLDQLPVISGVILQEQDNPGTKLNSPGLTTALKLIELMDSSILQNVAEIIAVSPESLALKTVQGVEVRFGKPEELERKIQIMQNLLIQNETIVNSQTVEYIDLRYDTSPVIKRKS